MEIKSKLLKPYTDEQKRDFIIKENHTNGYEIKETKTELQAWGYTEEELEQFEKDRIGELTCTKRDFILMLEELGFDYFEEIQPLIEADRRARLEWELCVALQRKNPLLDQFGVLLKITPKQLDKMFQYANGEIEKLK